MSRKETGRDKNTTKSASATTSTESHGLIPASTGINNSDIDDGWDDMATKGADDELMDTQVDNIRGYNDESHNKNSGLPPRTMVYNGTQLNSRD